MKKDKIKASLLFVDDEIAILEGYSLSFRDQPYRIFLASDAEDALEVLEGEVIDILVTDQVMPAMKGVELLDLVNYKWPHIQKILLTGNLSLEVAIDSINQGRIFRVLEKPCKQELLQEVINSALAELRQRHLAENVSINNDSNKKQPQQAQQAENLVDEFGEITPREREVLLCLIDGNRVKTISKKLDISVFTVRNHIKSLFRKLGVNSQERLIEKATGGMG